MTVYKGTELIAGIATVVDKSERVGQIVTSAIPLTDAGLHLLDGSLILGGGIYNDFVDYIATLSGTNPECFDTEANWQAAVAANGVCGKFVYDSVNNTVRLPKYSNKIYTKDLANTAGVKGNGMSLGITEGTNFGTPASTGQGPLYARSTAYGQVIGTTTSDTDPFTASKSIGVVEDSSKSGLIADLANITTSLEGYYYIVVATSTKTEIEVDIDEIATDLNGKADVDLTNVSNTSGFRKLVEIYNDGADWYKVYSEYNPSTGVYIGQWCEQGGFYYTGSGSGNTQIPLLKSYKDTNYKITFGQAMPAGTTTANAVYVRTTTIANASFSVYKPGGTYGWYWETKGYIS